MKNAHGRVILLVKLKAETCNYTKSNTPPCVFFTFIKLEMVPNRAKHHIFICFLSVIWRWPSTVVKYVRKIVVVLLSIFHWMRKGQKWHISLLRRTGRRFIKGYLSDLCRIHLENYGKFLGKFLPWSLVSSEVGDCMPQFYENKDTVKDIFIVIFRSFQ